MSRIKETCHIYSQESTTKLQNVKLAIENKCERQFKFKKRDFQLIFKMEWNLTLALLEKNHSRDQVKYLIICAVVLLELW